MREWALRSAQRSESTNRREESRARWQGKGLASDALIITTSAAGNKHARALSPSPGKPTYPPGPHRCGLVYFARPWAYCTRTLPPGGTVPGPIAPGLCLQEARSLGLLHQDSASRRHGPWAYHARSRYLGCGSPRTGIRKPSNCDPQSLDL